MKVNLFENLKTFDKNKLKMSCRVKCENPSYQISRRKHMKMSLCILDLAVTFWVKQQKHNHKSEHKTKQAQSVRFH